MGNLWSGISPDPTRGTLTRIDPWATAHGRRPGGAEDINSNINLDININPQKYRVALLVIGILTLDGGSLPLSRPPAALRAVRSARV